MAWTAALYRIPSTLAEGASSPADIKTLIETGVPELLAAQTNEGVGGSINLSNDGFPTEAGDLLVTVVTDGIDPVGVVGLRSDTVFECDTTGDSVEGEAPPSYYAKLPYYYTP